MAASICEDVPAAAQRRTIAVSHLRSQGVPGITHMLSDSVAILANGSRLCPRSRPLARCCKDDGADVFNVDGEERLSREAEAPGLRHPLRRLPGACSDSEPFPQPFRLPPDRSGHRSASPSAANNSRDPAVRKADPAVTSQPHRCFGGAGPGVPRAVAGGGGGRSSERPGRSLPGGPPAVWGTEAGDDSGCGCLLASPEDLRWRRFRAPCGIPLPRSCHPSGERTAQSRAIGP
jgi:hypothetical protein